MCTRKPRSASINISEGDQTDCVEVAGMADLVAMRDAKDPAGPVLAFSRHEWRTFVVGVRSGQFG
ncbi:MAG: DUF397 domain-containing protein [Pseudonocardiaceae bacterium]